MSYQVQVLWYLSFFLASSKLVTTSWYIFLMVSKDKIFSSMLRYLTIWFKREFSGTIGSLPNCNNVKEVMLCIWVLWCMYYIAMTNSSSCISIFFILLLNSMYTSVVTKHVQLNVMSTRVTVITDKCKMCMYLYNVKPTWRHQHSFSLDLMHLHIAIGWRPFT